MPYAKGDPRNAEAVKRHYYANKEQYFERNRRALAKKIAWVNERKAAPCIDCGVNYPPHVMDFDHREGTEKHKPVSRLLNNSWKRIKDEIAKCDLVCSNCHRQRTHVRLVENKLM